MEADSDGATLGERRWRRSVSVDFLGFIGRVERSFGSLGIEAIVALLLGSYD
jgi:hypothetical protein